VDVNLSILNLVIAKKKKKRERERAREREGYSGLTDTTVPPPLAPKDWQNLRTSQSLKMMSVNVSGDTLSKDCKEPRTEAPKIQHPATPRVLHTYDAGVLLGRNNVLRKLRKRLQNVLNFRLRG
jgi:hypothetical protein